MNSSTVQMCLNRCVFSYLVRILHLNDVGWNRSSVAVDLGLFTGNKYTGWKKVCLCTCSYLYVNI